MSVVDIVVIAVLALFAIIGLIRGFLNTLLSLFGNLASLAVAIVIVKPCAKFLDDIFHLVEKFGNLIIKGIANLLPNSEIQMSASDVINHLRGQGVLGRLVSLFVDKSDGIMYGTGATDLSATLSNSMGAFATSVVTIVVMFILIRFGVFLISKLFDAITKKTAFGGLDRFLGLVFGFVKGSILVFALLSVAYALSPLIPQIDTWIGEANFARWLYGYVNEFINWAINTVDWKGLLSFVGVSA